MQQPQAPNSTRLATAEHCESAKRPPRLPQVVAERLQRDLLEQGLRPGDRLPTEPQLAERYGVSRTVVREAGRILDQRGLVDIRPGRGMVVAQPDGSAVAQHYSLMLSMSTTTFHQLMQTRLTIEVEVAALAAEHRTDDDLAAIERSLAWSEQHPGDYRICLEEDLRFHELVTRASKNPFFSWFMDPVNTCLRESYKDEQAYLASLPSTFAEHRAIFDAITAADPDAARQASREHLQRVISEQQDLLPSPPTPPR
jgi:GntR family transcriptional repressor for pyruvate dehydrogenase complex